MCARLNRKETQLPADKFFRAAADLCRAGMRDVRFDKVDVDQVCGWHGIGLATQRKAGGLPTHQNSDRGDAGG